METDLEKVYRCAKLFASDKEIAGILGISPTAFALRKRKDHKIQQAIDLGRAEFKLSLREKQKECADAKNPIMLIWLGKQSLDQHDERSMKHSGSVSLNVAAAREGAMQKFRQLRSSRAEAVAAAPAEIEAGEPVMDAEVVEFEDPVPAERGEGTLDSESRDEGRGFTGLSIQPDG